MRLKRFAFLVILFPFPVFSLDCLLGDLEIRDTLDVYLSAQVVGNLVHSCVFDRPAAVLRVSNDLTLKTDAALTIHEIRSYNTSGAMIDARQDLRGQSGKNSWELKGKEGQWVYCSSIGGAVTSSVIAAVPDNLSSTCKLQKGIHDKTLKKGDAWNDTSFEMISARPLITRVTCGDIDTLRNLWSFDAIDNVSGRTEKQIVDNYGNTIEQSIEGLYTARVKNASRLLGDNALLKPSMTATAPPVSMTEMFSVPTNRKAGPGESIVVQLADTAERLDESVSDLYVAAGNKWALRPLPDRCVSSGALPRPSAVKQWLQATVTLQSDHHDIINLSKRLRRNEKDACTLIASFNHYVYTFLEKKPTATFSNALETLHAGYGDCGEHSALLAALLRACGIPARVVLGLLYVEQKKAYFYHSQVMAFSDEWIFADPTWDVCPAHGLFVPLIIDDTGSRAQALSRVIGRIAITYRKDDEKQGP